MGDSAGSQGFGIHAQKDLNVLVGNDKVEEITATRRTTFDVQRSHSVTINETIKVGGDQSLDVGAVLSHNVTGAQTIKGRRQRYEQNAISNFIEKIDRIAPTRDRNKITISNGIEHSVKGISRARSLAPAHREHRVGSTITSSDR